MIVAILLAFRSGLVDIIGCLGIFHFFVVQLKRGLAARQCTDVAVALAIVVAFLVGPS